MLLTKKKLHKIRNTKLQSRKRYKKKGGKRKRRKKRNNKSFRKRRPLNLRKKTLRYKRKRKRKNQKGGAVIKWAIPLSSFKEGENEYIDHFVIYDIKDVKWDTDAVTELFHEKRRESSKYLEDSGDQI